MHALEPRYSSNMTQLIASFKPPTAVLDGYESTNTYPDS